MPLNSGIVNTAPVVRADGDGLVMLIENTPGAIYSIDPVRYATPGDALRLIRDVTNKTWVTRRHVHELSILLMRHLGVESTS